MATHNMQRTLQDVTIKVKATEAAVLQVLIDLQAEIEVQTKAAKALRRLEDYAAKFPSEELDDTAGSPFRYNGKRATVIAAAQEVLATSTARVETLRAQYPVARGLAFPQCVITF